MCIVSVLLVSVVAVTASPAVSEEELASVPRLYHLDDYERCLAARAGLYCLGTLQVEEQHSPVYHLLKKYSSDPLHFNYTQLHRGYCVSARCPRPATPNATRRFELCAQRWASAHGLRVHLRTLHYCRTHHDTKRTIKPDTPQWVFLIVVGAILALNIAGTIYDLMVSDDVKKNQVVAAWSVRVSWRRLTRPAAPLPALHGLRVVVLAAVVWTHAGFVQHTLYVHSPRALESMMSSWVMMPIKNGTGLVQVFIIISSFLVSSHLLPLSEPIARLLPRTLLIRYIRIAPVHLVAVGFAATWWGELRDGPQWAPAVRAEAAACRRKFWPHALYIHNLVDPEDHCLIQTWYLAVDMQLHVVAATLTLVLRGRRAAPVLGALFLASCLLNGALAYAYRWKTMLYIMTPENLRTSFRHEPSFWWWYAAPWGSLPACLLGTLVAHAHRDLQLLKLQHKDYKWVRWVYRLYLPLGLCWVMSGVWVLQHGSRVAAAAHAALERPVLAALFAVLIFGLANNFDGIERNLLSWGGWRALSRLSLPALALHWCVGKLLAAPRPLPMPTSPLDVFSDFASTWAVTYLLATPAALLLELPAQRLAAVLLS